MIFRETFVDDGIKHFSDIGLDICTIWWIIPKDIASSSPLVLLVIGWDGRWLSKCDVAIVASIVKGIVIGRGSISKLSVGR